MVRHSTDRISHRIINQLISDHTVCAGTLQALYAVLFHIELQVAGNVHVQFGIDHRNLALGKPVVQQPEQLTMNSIFIFYDSTHLNIGNSEDHLLMLLVNLYFLDIFLLQQTLDHLAVLQIESSGLQVLYALVRVVAHSL